MFNEITHLTSAFTQQGNHIDVGFCVSRNHAKQCALADSRTGEDADSLSAADRQHPVDSAHARFEWLVDHPTVEWIRRLGSQWHTLGEFNWPFFVYRAAEAVEYPAEKGGTNVNSERSTQRLHEASSVQAIQLTQWHQDNVIIVKANDLSEYRAIICETRYSA